MLNTLIANMIEFGKSMPTNMLILLVICLIMKFAFKKSIKECIRVILAYLLIGVLFGIFGITMPDFLTIGRWIGNLVSSVT